jgi:hypothetical protein
MDGQLSRQGLVRLRSLVRAGTGGCRPGHRGQIGMGAPESTAGYEYYACRLTKPRMAGDLT